VKKLADVIGLRIGELIETLKIKKVRFAERLRIDQSYVTQLTGGKRKPSDRLVADICREFSVNEQWLRYGEGDMFTTTTEDQINLLLKELKADETSSRIIRGYFTLNEADRGVVKRFIEAIINSQPETERDSLSVDSIQTNHTDPNQNARIEALERENAKLRQKIQAMEEEDASPKAENFPTWTSDTA